MSRALLIAAAIAGAVAGSAALSAARAETWPEHIEAALRHNADRFDLDPEEQAERRLSLEHQRYCTAPSVFSRRVCEARRRLFEERQP